MEQDKKETYTNHPWDLFLKARSDCILWMRQKGDSDETITKSLSMDDGQVKAIRKACAIDLEILWNRKNDQ